MKKRRILVRVDGSKLIGLGHVYNMLTVLEHFKKDDILIVMRAKRSLGVEKFKKEKFKIKLFSKRNELKKIIEKFQPDIIFNDVLNTTVSYMQFLKKFDTLIVNFEDLGEGRKSANLVFNPIYYSVSSKTEFFGHRYACVRSEFRKSKKRETRKNVKKIVVTFGGTDPTNKTQNIIKLIDNFELKNIQWNFILGLGYSHKKEIKNIAKKMNMDGFNIKIIEKIDNISGYVKDCDFAITSNGRTVFELAVMEIPMISIAVNQREKQHSFVKYTKSGYHIDSPAKIETKKILFNINKMMYKRNRNQFIKNMRKYDILHGVNRVTEKINRLSIN